jgi:hypothetical protein
MQADKSVLCAQAVGLSHELAMTALKAAARTMTMANGLDGRGVMKESSGKFASV